MADGTLDLTSKDITSQAIIAHLKILLEKWQGCKDKFSVYALEQICENFDSSALEEYIRNNGTDALHKCLLKGETELPITLCAYKAKRTGFQSGSIIEALLENMVDINAKNSLGKTALHIAAEQGNVIVIDFLLKRTDKINELDNNKRTPLHYAVLCGDINVVKLFLNHKHIALYPAGTQSILNIALRTDSIYDPIVDLLLKQNVKFSFGTALTREDLIKASIKNHAATLQCFISDEAGNNNLSSVFLRILLGYMEAQEWAKHLIK